MSDGFTNLTHVRFEIGDTDPDRAWFSDEEVNAVVADQGSWQSAVIACLLNIVSRITSEPTFHADWLSVDYKTALDNYQKLLTIKSRQLNVPFGQIQATAVYMWRPDSNQLSEPTYPLDSDIINS